MSEFALAEQPLGVAALGGSTFTSLLRINPFITVISQYANSPRITALVDYMRQWVDPSANLDAFYNFVWNVDTAQGWGLDVLGRIVGVTRVLNVAIGGYLGFSQDTDAQPFGSGIWYSGGALTSNYALTDEAYRTLILAKAALNLTDGSIPAVNAIILNLFGQYGDSYVKDNLDMSITYHFGATLNPVDAAIVNQSGVLPRGAGVSYSVES